MRVRPYLLKAIIVCLLILCATALLAQGSGILRGQVTDPSGAAITNANISLTPTAAGSTPLTTQTNGQGFYEFKGLAAGKYTLNVVAQGFTLYENDNVVVADQPLRLNITMAIEVQQQKVQVSDTAPTVDVNPSNNAGAIVISGKELEALPDDPDELESDLEALAGPSAGPNGGQMYIDGFTAGQLPPKSSIREIRINQNPFSSEYDKLGYGRIEIFTKPGTDKFHGQVFVDGNDSVFNSPNPFAGPEPSYDSTQFQGNVGGPLGRNASFFLDAQRRNINDLEAVNAITLDPTTFAQVPVVEAVPYPRHRTNISPRLDYAVTKNNTLTARYQYYRDTEDNESVGQFNLASEGYNSTSIEHTLQVSDTQVFGAKIVNETRFQYLRDLETQLAVSTLPTLNVLGAFGGGGNSQGDILDHQDHYELQNYTSIIHGNHNVKFGARLRGVRDANSSTSGFNGIFTFSSLTDTPEETSCVPVSGQPPCPISYQHALENAGITTTPIATQLTYTTGTPPLVIGNFDAGLYYQDDWRVVPNITLSYGLRFETQTEIADHNDWAPRLGFAWGVGGRSRPPKVVIRGGFGIFYDRFQAEQILEAQRLNGITQEQFFINNPECPSLSDLTACAGAVTPVTPTTYSISPRLHAPYTLQSAVSVERQVTKSATLSLTYLDSRGFDQLLTINANAPYPGTPCGVTGLPNCQVRTGGNLYQYVSEAVFRQNQFIANTNIRVGSKLQLFGYYVLNYANSDTSGVSSLPSNSYNISADYGRASFDTRNRLFLGGSIALPLNFRLSPFMIVSSGSPFTITTVNDLNNDSVFNDRPALLSSCPSGTPPVGVYCTPLGNFNAVPTPGSTIVPINSVTGPNHFDLNLRLTKTFGFGPKANSGPANPGAGPGGGGHHHGGPLFGGGGPMGLGPASDRRYNLTFGISARNAFNNVNLSNPSGILGSRFFDTSNALQTGPFSNSAANRRVDLQATFSF